MYQIGVSGLLIYLNELRWLLQSDTPEYWHSLVTSMLPLRRTWGHRCLSKRFERELSLAYNLHDPSNPESGHAPLIVLHGLFGSKQNNRSISKYGLSCRAFHVCHLIRVEHLHEISKRQCMRLSVVNKTFEEMHFAHHAVGSEKSWRFTARSSPRLLRDGGWCGRVHPTAWPAATYNDRSFHVSFDTLHKVSNNAEGIEGAQKLLWPWHCDLLSLWEPWYQLTTHQSTLFYRVISINTSKVCVTSRKPTSRDQQKQILFSRSMLRLVF